MMGAPGSEGMFGSAGIDCEGESGCSDIGLSRSCATSKRKMASTATPIANFGTGDRTIGGASSSPTRRSAITPQA
jgi:hypothetical protein